MEKRSAIKDAYIPQGEIGKKSYTINSTFK